MLEIYGYSPAGTVVYVQLGSCKKVYMLDQVVVVHPLENDVVYFMLLVDNLRVAKGRLSVVEIPKNQRLGYQLDLTSAPGIYTQYRLHLNVVYSTPTRKITRVGSMKVYSLLPELPSQEFPYTPTYPPIYPPTNPVYPPPPLPSQSSPQLPLQPSTFVFDSAVNI